MNEDSLVLQTKRKRGSEVFKLFSVRIRQSVVDGLDELSDRCGHTRNELIDTLLEYAIKHCVVQ